MSARICCVVGCTNGVPKLKKWKSQICGVHGCNFGTGCCVCEPPFLLLPFPTVLKDSHARNIWTKNINRGGIDGAAWMPKSDTRICSNHFEDGKPTAEHPYPTLNLGHTNATAKERLPPKERSQSVPAATPKKPRKTDIHKYDEEPKEIQQHPHTDHDYLEHCTNCTHKLEEIADLKDKIKKLTLELRCCREKLKQKNKVQRVKASDLLSSDKKVRFYTGIPSKQLFDGLYDIIEPYLKDLRYWKGPSYHCSTLHYKKFIKPRTARKLTAKEEMLMTCMKIRLGLLDQDLADRFGVSTSFVSRIFTTWIRILKKFICTLIVNHSKEIVRNSLPPSFRNAKYFGVRHIIDCSEVFIEKPHSIAVQNGCWSDYKHHHTAKFLVSINPSGTINILSECWGGRVSDKHITLNSGFMDIVDPYDVVLADKGFSNMQADFTLQRAFLQTPPGKHGVSQMPAKDVIKTKEIANRRIFVEQAIRRMKCFRILKYEVPVTLCQHLDDIVKIIGGICNMYPPLPKY